MDRERLVLPALFAMNSEPHTEILQELILLLFSQNPFSADICEYFLISFAREDSSKMTQGIILSPPSLSRVNQARFAVLEAREAIAPLDGA